MCIMSLRFLALYQGSVFNFFYGFVGHKERDANVDRNQREDQETMESDRTVGIAKCKMRD